MEDQPPSCWAFDEDKSFQFCQDYQETVVSVELNSTEIYVSAQNVCDCQSWILCDSYNINPM